MLRGAAVLGHLGGGRAVREALAKRPVGGPVAVARLHGGMGSTSPVSLAEESLA